jgi:hypothetical protein
MELDEKWPVNLACDSNFHVNCRVILHAANLRHGTDGFTSPPKEALVEFLGSSSLEILNQIMNPPFVMVTGQR